MKRSRDLARKAGATFALLLLGACATGERRFALRASMTLDTDLRSVAVPCRPDPTPRDPKHMTCAPESYVSPVIWDGADNLLFRPLSEALAFEATGESVNVNSLDEVPDSAWFTNRIGVHPMSVEDIQRGACEPSKQLYPDADLDGSWVIDKGKENGSSPGFRVLIPGKGKFMFKSDGTVPEHASAASVVGAAAYNAVGFNTSCEQIVYFRPSLLKLNPGLRVAGNFAGGKPFDRTALDAILAATARRDGLLRFQASAWLLGRVLGPFRYQGTRRDDPNDVIPHENRRELRGGALLAAWLDHFDAREQNSMDSWIADDPKDRDSSPGHVVHYYLDTSDSLGSAWDWDEITRRLGFSYIVDWGDLSRDFVTLGIHLRPWDRVKRIPGFEQFVYFDVDDFEADKWKNEYPNPAFSRMTERDGAWMARILSRFSPEAVKALAEMANFTDHRQTDYLAYVLEGRLQKILERYLTHLSPIADLHVKDGRLCGVDLAEARSLRNAQSFRYSAHTKTAGGFPSTAGPLGRGLRGALHTSPPTEARRTTRRSDTCVSSWTMAWREGSSLPICTTSGHPGGFDWLAWIGRSLALSRPRTRPPASSGGTTSTARIRDRGDPHRDPTEERRARGGVSSAAADHDDLRAEVRGDSSRASPRERRAERHAHSKQARRASAASRAGNGDLQTRSNRRRGVALEVRSRRVFVGVDARQARVKS